MKERVEYIVDSFEDYKGETHKFIVAALSQTLPIKSGQLEDNPLEDANTPVTHIVEVCVDDLVSEIGTVTKVLKLGVAICNPTDPFNEEVGVKKAVKRAEESDPVLYAANPGVINSKMVRGLLAQEACYLKDNPELLITGYEDMKERYLLNKKMEAMKADFTELENTVMDKLEENPTWVDKIFQYLKWKKNQEKGAHTN